MSHLETLSIPKTIQNTKPETQLKTQNSKLKTQNAHILRGVFRLFGIAFIIVGHLIPVLIGRVFLGKNMWWAVKRRQGIARHLVRFLNIKIEMTGAPTVGNFLYISNHRSYIDPVCTALWIPFVPIAKAEIGKCYLPIR